MQTQLDSFSQFPVNFQPESNKAYVERVEIDNDDIDISDLFGNAPSQSPTTYKSLPFDTMPSSEDNLGQLHDYVSKPTEMMGVSPLTKYGPSKIDLASIPKKYRGRCRNCGTIINVNWKFCGKCGQRA